MNYVICGNAAEACRRSGYSTPDTDKNGFSNMGWRLLQNDAVRRAVTEECRKWFHSAAAAAVAEVHRIVGDKTAKDADKLRAAAMVLDRTDPATSVQRVEVEHQHVHTLNAAEIEKRIAELAAKVGVKAPPPAVVIDAEAEEVEE